MKLPSAPLFLTNDMYLASTITYFCNIDPALKCKSGIVTFSFPQSEKVLALVRDYATNAIDVKALTYVDTIKRLRHEMLQCRSEVMNQILQSKKFGTKKEIRR